MTAYQMPLLTVAGQPWTLAAQKRDVRKSVIKSLGQVFGDHALPDACCEHCGHQIRYVPHPSAAFVYCACGSEEFSADDLLGYD